MDSREPVLVVSRQVDVGEEITRDMLESRNVSGRRARCDPGGPGRQDHRQFYARQTLYPGQLLQAKLLRTSPPLEVDQAQVGVPLTSGKYPPGLRSGDAVRLVRIGDSQNPSEALATGLVLSISKAKSSGFGSDARASVATVVVPQGVVDDIVGATGTDDPCIAIIGRGIAMDEDKIAPSPDGGRRWF